VPHRYEQPAVDAVERCPGACIYLESDALAMRTVPETSDADVVDAEVIEH
jgi:hypothetical protein